VTHLLMVRHEQPKIDMLSTRFATLWDELHRHGDEPGFSIVLIDAAG
jgi:hypothetical protein